MRSVNETKKTQESARKERKEETKEKRKGKYEVSRRKQRKQEVGSRETVYRTNIQTIYPSSILLTYVLFPKRFASSFLLFLVSPDQQRSAKHETPNRDLYRNENFQSLSSAQSPFNPSIHPSSSIYRYRIR